VYIKERTIGQNSKIYKALTVHGKANYLANHSTTTQDFMDNLNGSPDGTYDIRAFNGGETFSKEVTIYRSEPVSSSNQ